jgi:hypothetical protein
MFGVKNALLVIALLSIGTNADLCLNADQFNPHAAPPAPAFSRFAIVGSTERTDGGSMCCFELSEVELYSWIPYNSGIRQSGLTPSILHYNCGSVITFVSALCVLRRLSYFSGPELSSCFLG